jgi:hypothetical protein
VNFHKPEQPAPSEITPVDDHSVGSAPSGLLKAATRDAAWYGNPSINRGVKYHVCLGGEFVPACNPDGALLTEWSWQDATSVPEYQRCQRPGCRVRWPS